MNIDPKDVVLTTKHLNDNLNKSMFLLILDEKRHINMIGCPTVADIHRCAEQYSVFDANDFPDLGKFALLKITPIDPTDLPYELHITDDAFVIYEDWYMAGPLEHMTEVTKDIEEMFESFEDSKIEDFAVLIGRSVGDNIKNALVRRLKDAAGEV